MESRHNTPADGERRALGGYFGQIHHVSAYRIIDALRRGSLNWISVADPSAGRVDDLQIGSDATVIGYQIKWAQYAGSFTFRDLINSEGDKPSLIYQLVDGWKRINSDLHRPLVPT